MRRLTALTAGAPSAASVTEPTHRRRAITAASVGQFFELYDFSIYGFFAPEIGRAFFPSADPAAHEDSRMPSASGRS